VDSAQDGSLELFLDMEKLRLSHLYLNKLGNKNILENIGRILPAFATIVILHASIADSAVKFLPFFAFRVQEHPAKRLF